MVLKILVLVYGFFGAGETAEQMRPREKRETRKTGKREKLFFLARPIFQSRALCLKYSDSGYNTFKYQMQTNIKDKAKESFGPSP